MLGLKEPVGSNLFPNETGLVVVFFGAEAGGAVPGHAPLRTLIPSLTRAAAQDDSKQVFATGMMQLHAPYSY